MIHDIILKIVFVLAIAVVIYSISDLEIFKKRVK
jgi:hypothetical protein